MTQRLTYRDYLVWTAANTIGALTDAIRVAMDMSDDYYAEQHLEAKLRIVRALAQFESRDADVVGPPTPKPDDNEMGGEG